MENIRAVIISVAFALCLMDFSLNTLFIPFPLLFPSSFRLSLAIFFLICQIFSKKKIAIFARWTCSDASAFLLKLHWLYKEFHFKCDKGVKKNERLGKEKAFVACQRVFLIVIKNFEPHPDCAGTCPRVPSVDIVINPPKPILTSL